MLVLVLLGRRTSEVNFTDSKKWRAGGLWMMIVGSISIAFCLVIGNFRPRCVVPKIICFVDIFRWYILRFFPFGFGGAKEIFKEERKAKSAESSPIVQDDMEVFGVR